MSIFSATLTRLRKEKNLSKSELAEILNVSKSYIAGLETDYITPGYDILNRIAEVFDVTTDYLIGVSEEGTIKERYLKVPVVSCRVASNTVIQERDIEDTIVIPLPPSHDDYLAMIVDDDCMINMRIKKGDTVVIKRMCSVENGDIAAVSFNGGPVFLRKYFRRATKVTLFADSLKKEYPAIEFDLSDTRYRVLGKVVWFIGKLS